MRRILSARCFAFILVLSSALLMNCLWSKPEPEPEPEPEPLDSVDLLGSAITDENGNFEIKYDQEDFNESAPDIYLKIKTQDGGMIHTTEDNVRNDAGGTEEFNVKISKNYTVLDTLRTFRIYGKVTELETGKGMSNLIVKAIDTDADTHELLGAAATDENGNFEIKYDEEDLHESAPDIYLKIKTQDGEVICTTEDTVRYDAGDTEEFNVKIPKNYTILYTLETFRIYGKLVEKETGKGIANVIVKAIDED